MKQYFGRHWEWGQHRQEGHRNGTYGWFPVAFCLHVLMLAAVLAFLLSACGGAAHPWGYVWTDAQHVETLSWHVQNGQLSGQYSGISYAQVSFPSTTQPDSYGAAYQGTINGQTVTLTIGSGLLSQHLEGTLSGDENILTLTVLDPSSSKAVQQQWVAVSASQQSQLVSACNAYEQARAWLTLVQQERQRERDWQDPNASFLATTQTALQNQQAQVEQMQQAQDLPTRCSLVAAYRPLDASWFTLPFPASGDGLLAALAHFQQAWQRAEQSQIPHIAALTLPWLLSPAEEQQAIAPASTLAAHLQASYRADEQVMQHDQQESRQLDTQVTHVAQGCPPTPA